MGTEQTYNHLEEISWWQKNYILKEVELIRRNKNWRDRRQATFILTEICLHIKVEGAIISHDQNKLWQFYSLRIAEDNISEESVNHALSLISSFAMELR